MSLIQMDFFSKALNMFTSVNVILPLPRDAKAEIAPLKALLLLHGMGDDASAWLRKTSIERYALDAGLAVVMPDGGLSCYQNMVHGENYRDYIAEELPRAMREYFPLSAAREDNFIAGCSMGGFGALKIGLSHPEAFCAIGCFSAAHMEFRPDSPRVQTNLARVYGDQIDQADAEVVRDAYSVIGGCPELQILHYAGDRDILLENALKTRDFFEKMHAPSLKYSFELLSGKHDWALWDESVRRLIEALKLPRPEARLN